jgi:hypothetical protein
LEVCFPSRLIALDFWDKPPRFPDMAPLLKAEQEDLLAGKYYFAIVMLFIDLRALPRNSTVRKINELVKRARMAKVHAYICHHLREQFGLFGKSDKQSKLISNLPEEFKKISSLYSLPPGDFPQIKRFSEKIENYEIWKFPKIDKKMIAAMDNVLSVGTLYLFIFSSNFFFLYFRDS